MIPMTPLADQLPEGTPDDVRAGRGTREIRYAWNGKRYRVVVKPLSWGIEKRAIRACSDATGVDPGAFIDFMLDALVEESSVPLKGVDRLGHEPDFIWTTAREMGLLAHLRKLGIKLLNDEAARLTVDQVLRHYLVVEHKLRRAGYTTAEIEKLNPDEVRKLFDLDQADNDAALEKLAATFAQVVAHRMGM